MAPPSLRDRLARLGRITRPVELPERPSDQSPLAPQEPSMPISEPLIAAQVAAYNILLERTDFVLNLAPPGLAGAVTPTGGALAALNSTNNLLAVTTITKRVQATARPGSIQPPVVTPPTGTPGSTGGTGGTGTVPTPPSSFDPPITITAGGTYTGNWKSTDPSVPAVTITTTQPVIIEGSYVDSVTDCIRCRKSGADVTIRNTVGISRTPNVNGKCAGRFADLQGLKNIVVEHNDMTGGGVYVYQFTGNGSAGQTIKVRYNRARDINGQFSDGQGGYQTGASSFFRVQFVQFNAVTCPGAEIAWNWVTNTARASHIEDTINLYASFGAAGNPIKVHHNLLDGAYAWVPDGPYTGGGIMLGDGGGGYQEATDNIVLETSNYGIAVADGNNMAIRNNVVLGRGKLDDGTLLDAQTDAGIYVRKYGSTTPARVASSVVVEGNTVGWGNPSTSNPNARWDISVEAGMATVGTNTKEPTGAIAETRKQQARDVSAGRVSAASLSIGPAD